MKFAGSLPLVPPLAPMLAKGGTRVPDGEGWLHEPKWDGFRVVVFRDGEHLELQSRSKKPLFRYFPEVEGPLKAALPERCVVDGELIIRQDGGLSFGALQMRLHPARSRIEKLAAELPAELVLWDLLAIGDESLLEVELEQRRLRLEREVSFGNGVHLTPATRDAEVARDWFARFEGAGLDGVVSKQLSGYYEPGKRVMKKTKRNRTVDCVLVGFRWHKSGPVVGSLILGLYDDEGRLHQLGVASSFTAARRQELVEELAPLREGAIEAHPWREWAGDAVRQAGVKSRWHGGRDLSWEPVRLERVLEVECNQLSDGRLRHPARFVRWRPDREPASCTLEQIEERPAPELAALLGQSAPRARG